MKKLAGLLAFAVALAGAIMLTQYYTRRYAPPPPPPPPVAAAPAAPAPPVTGAGMAKLPPPAASYTDPGKYIPVSFKVQLATLDLAAGKGRLTLALERDNPKEPLAPGRVWVWAYFFSPDAPGRYCAGDPVELRNPFGKADTGAVVKVELPVQGCPAPRSPSSTYYTRVNVSAESAFAARLPEQRISYDITRASGVVVEGKQK
jgi:hypothetical protein